MHINLHAHVYTVVTPTPEHGSFAQLLRSMHKQCRTKLHIGGTVAQAQWQALQRANAAHLATCASHVGSRGYSGTRITYIQSNRCQAHVLPRTRSSTADSLQVL
jgi:hypothetical protein